LEKLLKIHDFNPSDILDLKKIIIKKERKINQIDFKILAIYVE
jgi:hypothetical protein